MSDSVEEPGGVRLFDGGWRAHVLFAGLTVFMSGSLPFHLGGCPLSQPGGDIGNTQWNLWWVGEVLSGRGGEGGGLMHSPGLFFPAGADLVWNTTEYLWGIGLWPLRLALGGFAQHNVALILATYLTAWFAFLAARQVGAGFAGAAAASAAVALHGYRLMESYHLNIFTTFPLPGAIWLVLRLGANPGDRRAALGLGALAVATLLSSIFHAFGCAILGVGLAGWLLWRHRADGVYTRRLLGAVGIAVGIALPVLAWIAWHMARADAPVAFTALAVAEKAADPWQFLIPARARLAMTGLPTDVMDLIAAGQAHAAVWYLPGFLLAACALWGVWRSDAAPAARAVLAIGGVFAVLSLGPYLRMGPPWTANPEPTLLPLPGLLIRWIPGLGTLRSVWHFGFLATICMAVVGGAGLERLLATAVLLPHRRVLAVLAVLVAGAETYRGSLFTQPAVLGVPTANYLRDSATRDDAVLAYPFALYEVRGFFMWQQTVHRRPMATGYLSRDPASFDAWRGERVWPNELEDICHSRIDRFTPPAEAMFREDVAALRIRHMILFDPEDGTNMRSANVRRELGRMGLGRPVERDAYFVVFEVGGEK